MGCNLEKTEGAGVNYFVSNKDAWEEAFERRSPAWCSDLAERITREDYAFFSADLREALQGHDLKGKSVAQFCCNNGRELLSLTRSAATAQSLGFDIAQNMVDFANAQAASLGKPCSFVQGNILEIDPRFNGKFDVLLITLGALCWFNDLNAFFTAAARILKPGGLLLMLEQHPVANMLALPGDDNYHSDHPTRLVNSGFSKTWENNSGMHYMTGREYESKTFTDFTHSLGEIITVICTAGLQLRWLKESDIDHSEAFTALDGRGIPLSFLLEAGKPLE